MVSQHSLSVVAVTACLRKSGRIAAWSIIPIRRAAHCATLAHIAPTEVIIWLQASVSNVPDRSVGIVKILAVIPSGSGYVSSAEKLYATGI
jgi:hypothetical protein